MKNTAVYNFIIPETRGYTLEDFAEGTLEDFGHLYVRGEYCWGLQTFKVLQHGRLDVRLSHSYDHEAVNLGHGNALRGIRPERGAFAVCMQADFPHFPLADLHVVQNPDQQDKRSIYMPLWPQIGLVPRSPERREVRVLAYQGRIDFAALDVSRLGKDLEPHGIEFRVLGEDEWADLSEVDLLLGIRTFGRKAFRRKPPSKLTNAWHAGVPFIGGWDSAFTHAGVPGEDFIRVGGYDELLNAVVGLKDDPVRYARLVENGRKKAPEYTFEALADRWEKLLTGPVDGAYSRWRADPMSSAKFYIRNASYKVNQRLRQTVRGAYSIPLVKELRHRHFDPVK